MKELYLDTNLYNEYIYKEYDTHDDWIFNKISNGKYVFNDLENNIYYEFYKNDDFGLTGSQHFNQVKITIQFINRENLKQIIDCLEDIKNDHNLKITLTLDARNIKKEQELIGIDKYYLEKINLIDFTNNEIIGKKLCKNLVGVKGINLSNCYNINDNCISNLIDNDYPLQTIILSNCNFISNKTLKIIGETYKNHTIYDLNLSNCSLIGDKGIEQLFKNSINIHCLNLSATEISNKSLKYFRKVHTLNLFECLLIGTQGIKNLQLGNKNTKITNINLGSCPIYDESLKYFSGVFLNFVSFENCDELTDKGLKNIIIRPKKINLAGCNITNETTLMLNEDFSDISNCPRLTNEILIDFRPKILFSRMNPNITELKKLGEKYDGVKFQEVIDFSNCYNIKNNDLQNLFNIYAVNLSGCFNINDEGVINLAKGVVDGEVFIKRLNLSYTDITDKSIKYFRNTEKIVLSGCQNITDKELYHLKNVNSIDLSHCNKIRSDNIDVLNNVKELNLSHCSNITNVNGLCYVQNLNLANCQKIIDVNNLGTVKILNLSYCEGITDVSMLGDVHTLDISFCKNIKSVSMLTNVHKLIGIFTKMSNEDRKLLEDNVYEFITKK